MIRTLPSVRNAEEFARIVRDETVLAPGVTRILDMLGVHAPAERFATGSLPVYALGSELVLKLYAPYDHGEAAREARFLEVLDGRLPIATPKLHALGEIDGWSYVLMGRLRGELLATANERIERRELRRLATKLGEALRALHALRDERLAPDRVDWRALARERRRSTLALQAKRGLSPKWLEQIPDFLNAECPLLETAAAETPLHTEVMREHLYLERRGGSWELSGLFDFEPSIVGPAEYEFSAVGLFVSCGDRELFRDVLTAYGYPERALEHAFERRILAYALLHAYSNLPWYMSRIPPPARVVDFDALAAHFFGV
ncbi:MAG TPA: phosphotransferase [Polyangiaceae bacterium]